MRVKFFTISFPRAIPNNLGAESYLFTATREIETMINDWLAYNKGIKITETKQFLFFQPEDNGWGHFHTTIWYEETTG